MHRHARQMRLPEIGPSGQERIRRARVDVPLRGLAAEVAVRYLVGAGVGRLRVPDPALAEVAWAIDSSIDVEVDPTLEAGEAEARAATVAFGLVHPASREVALGSHFALRGLRTALEVGS